MNTQGPKDDQPERRAVPDHLGTPPNSREGEALLTRNRKLFLALEEMVETEPDRDVRLLLCALTAGFAARFRKWSARIPDRAIPKFVPPEGSEKLEIAPIARP